MRNLRKGGGMCLPERYVETRLIASPVIPRRHKWTSLRPHPRNQDVPQNIIGDIRKGERYFAQYGRHTSTRKRANNYSPLPLILIFICCLFNKEAFAQSRQDVGAVAGVGEIKPLQIGDTIPEELWKMPLQVVNHPKGKETITLNDYRDKKLIILDFWASYCKPCLQSIRKLDSIVKLLDNDNILLLPIQVYDEPSRALSAIEQQQWNLPSVVNDTILNKQAFYNYLTGFGVVWIRDDQLVAVPRSKDLTMANIARAVKGEDLSLEFRKGYPLLNRRQP